MFCGLFGKECLVVPIIEEFNGNPALGWRLVSSFVRIRTIPAKESLTDHSPLLEEQESAVDRVFHDGCFGFSDAVVRVA